MIHKRISWNCENIPKSGSKFRDQNYEKLKLTEKVHRIRKTSQNRFSLFARYYEAEEVIHKRNSWNLENISKSGPKISANNYEKLNIWWKGASDTQNLTEPYYAFSQGITMLKTVFISAIPEIGKISQNLGLNLGQNLWKIKSLIGSAKHHRTVFRFFARNYNEEVIHKRNSWNWENISKSRPIWAKNYEKLNHWWKGAS